MPPRHVTVRHRQHAARCPYCRRPATTDTPCRHYVGVFEQRDEALAFAASRRYGRVTVQADPPQYRWGLPHESKRPWFVFQDREAGAVRWDEQARVS